MKRLSDTLLDSNISRVLVESDESRSFDKSSLLTPDFMKGVDDSVNATLIKQVTSRVYQEQSVRDYKLHCNTRTYESTCRI